MYDAISKILISAKKSHDINKAKEALSLVVDQVQSFIEAPRNKGNLDRFVQDPNYLFETQAYEASSDSADMFVETQGLLSEILAQAGITESLNLSNKLKEVILDINIDLHHNQSISAKNRSRLQEVLDSIMFFVEAT